ncbi:hypothetical protein IAT38_002936 [Cryptococcus sp. DSM 104549]
MRSSSPAEPSPTALRRTNSLTGRVAKRTYGRRVTVHKEKRKAEAQLSSDDSASDGDEEEGRTARRLADGLPQIKRRDMGIDKGRSGGAMAMAPSASASSSTQRFKVPVPPSSSPLSSPPPSRSPSPTPSSRVRRVAPSPGTHPIPSTSLTRPRLQSRAAPRRSTTAPEVNIQAPTSPAVPPTPSQPPSTPPRPSPAKRQRSSAPRPKPKDLSALFAAISPQANSPGSSAGEESAGGSKPVGRPSGLRRMLTKTQSLGVAPLTPSKKDGDEDPPHSPFGSGMSAGDPTTPSRGAVRRTQSMPESPAKSSPRDPDRGAGLVVPPVQEQAGSGGRARRTYGKVRTMMVEVSQAGEGRGSGVLGDTEDEDTMPQASYAELRQRYEVDNTVDPSESGSASLLAELLQAKAPQTVSDMRSRGENRRFTDQLGYLVEGMTDSSASMAFKRSSAIDVLQNMQEDTWMGKLKICGQVDRVWDCFHSTRANDDIMEAACLLFLAILLDSGSGLDQVVQIHPEECTPLVMRAFKTRDGPLDRSSKIKPTNAVQRLRVVSSKLNLGWEEDEDCNTRRIASAILSDMCRETLWASTGSLIEEGKVLEKTLKSMGTEVRAIAERFRLYEKGLDMLPADCNLDFFHLYSCLQVVPSIMAKSHEGREMLIEHHRETVQDLVNTAIISTNAALSTEGRGSLQASKCSIHTVQLLANLANLSSEWAVAIIKADGSLTCIARLVLHRDAITAASRRGSREGSVGSLETEVDDEDAGQEKGASSGKEMSKQEFLCLLLALLTTAVLTGERIAETIALTKLAPDCVGEHACLRHCQCLSALTLGQHLAKLYSAHLGDDDDPLSSILTGYLALLLSKLAAATSASTLELIVSPLPGSTRPAKLKGLLASLRELNDLQSMMQKTIKNILPQGVSSEDVAVEASMVEDEADKVADAIREVEALVS